MIDYLEYLECGHCGRAAIEADGNDNFWDGDGGECAWCGFPGHVSADEETCYWNDCDAEASDVCEDPGCRSCIRPARREYTVRCLGCGGPTPVERHCYAHPACYECRPPPEPLPILEVFPSNTKQEK